MTVLTLRIPFEFKPQVKRALYLYPDVFDFSYDASQYYQLWARLHEEHKGYLIVEKGHLNRVNWFRYAFEQVKGWFGYSNACEPNKISMAAQKLAYYGYLNEFPQKPVLDTVMSWHQEYRPNQEFMGYCQLKRTNETSGWLQQQLLSFYQEHALVLDALEDSVPYGAPNPCHDNEFKFGSTYAFYDNQRAMASVDVQDRTLIINALDKIPDVENTLPRSTFRRLYIDRVLRTLSDSFEASKQPAPAPQGFFSLLFPTAQANDEYCAKLHDFYDSALNALRYYPELISEHHRLLIDLSIELAKESFSTPKKASHYEEAFRLISAHCDKNKSYDYLSRYFLVTEAFSVLKRDSELIQSWGTCLYQHAMKEYPQGTSSLALYRVALICQDLIEDRYLARAIDSCSAEKKYVLMFRFIKRLFEIDADKALKYLENNHRMLYSFLEKDTPISQAYAKKLTQNAQLSWTILGFKDTKYDEAVELDPSIKYQDAAPYFLERYARQKQWYEAYDLLHEISEHYDENKVYDYLSRYFLVEDAFSILRRDSELVQSWGSYLYQNAIKEVPQGTSSLALYRAALIRPDLIEDQYLERAIDACSAEKEYALCFRFIERLFPLKADKALNYIKNHHQLLFGFLKKDTAISQAYAKQLTQKAKSSWTLFGNKDAMYEEAVELTPFSTLN